jgi:hypothetical protein
MDRYLFVVISSGVYAVVDTQPSSGNALVIATSDSTAAMAAYRDSLNGV